ncbi:hypothetical protein, partial [Desulfolutivibrio sulfodismutans]|uniref:hypothetical protein n=1 Tax=Desulfolutivibrio sulfodismutans TaxID=63561 RepID=UPI001BA66B98
PFGRSAPGGDFIGTIFDLSCVEFLATVSRQRAENLGLTRLNSKDGNGNNELKRVTAAPPPGKDGQGNLMGILTVSSSETG